MYNGRFASLVLACFISVSFCLPAVLADKILPEDIVIEDIEVIDLESRSNVGEYIVGEEGLALESEYLIDRTYHFNSMTPELEGATYIVTAMEDETGTGPDFITFKVEVPVIVWICSDKRQGGTPAWLSEDEGWTLQGDGTPDGDMVLESTDGGTNFFVIRSKEFPPGEISLNGNIDPPAGIAPMYFVILTLDPNFAVEATGKLSTTWAELKAK